MKFDQKPMVGWFDVKQLVSTGLKTVISMAFGNYADKREIQAALTQNEPYNYSNKEDIWIDYISDLGDGFNSTYTMAHLLAQDYIEINCKQLSRGDILIMGGDEVYPTPEKIEYQNRLQGPYNAAFPWKKDEPKKLKPNLYAIPGNHDWYDGLTNFIRLFCQGRALGNWLTVQKRSYFAIKLPHSYWLIGIDIQLKGDIDEPQLTYFKDIAKKEFKDGDKVILCTAEPTWVHASLTHDFEADQRIRYFINKILKGENDDFYNRKKDSIHIAAILTGDLHHYSRYETEKNSNGKITQLITSGGGGAFMHPTHMLKEKIEFEDGSAAERLTIFPDAGDSKKLAFRNLAFPYYNWSMCLFFGIFHVLTTWFLQSSTHNSPGGSFMETIADIDISMANLGEYLLIVFDNIKHSPSVFILNLILFSGVLLFTDTKYGKHKWNYIPGAAHSILQLSNLYFWIWVFSIWNLNHLFLPIDGIWQILLFSIEIIVIGGIASGFIFGIYLLVSILIFESHPTEASSSFRHEGYKNFLRMHLTKEKLTIYAIGLKTVVKNWKDVGTNEKKPIFEGKDIAKTLIEEIDL